MAVDPEGREVAVAEGLRGGLDSGDTAQFRRERVPGAVHVQSGADAVADEARLLEHPVPPAVHRVGGTSLLRVRPVDATIRRALLGIEEVVVWLRAATNKLERLTEVGAERHDDSPAEGDDSFLLTLAEDDEPASRKIEVVYLNTGELSAPDAAVEQDQQGKTIARGPRAAKEQLVDVSGEERGRFPRRARSPDL